MKLSGDEIIDAMHSSKDAELPSGELTGRYISLSIITPGSDPYVVSHGSR